MDNGISNKKSKGFLPLLILAITGFLLSAAASFLYITAHNSSYDGALHHFEVGTVLLTVSVILFAASVIPAFICAALYRRIKICTAEKTTEDETEEDAVSEEVLSEDEDPDESEAETGTEEALPLPDVLKKSKEKKFGTVYIGKSKFEIVVRIFIGVLFLYLGISQLVSGITSEMISILGKIAAALVCPLQVVSGIAMIFSVFSERLVPKGMNRILSLFPVLSTLVMLLNLYFDSKGLPMNDPDLMLALAAVGVSSFILLSESRFFLDINTVSIASFTLIIQLSFVLSGAMTVILINNSGYTCPLGVNYFILVASYSFFALIRLVQLIKALKTAKEQ